MCRFDGETGLSKALETAVNYNLLMRDFPISKLLTVNDIEGIRAAVIDIFGHMKKVVTVGQGRSRYSSGLDLLFIGFYLFYTQ